MISQFGTGEFNLLTLLSLRPDYIKFNPDIIHQAEDANVRFFLSKLVESMHHIGTLCIAQGVESEATRALIEKTGIDAFSGSYAGTIFEVTHE
jgi:EAL domain-containing protein (putative c-di-GMP-specific phosphodiesterase class I)